MRSGQALVLVLLILAVTAAVGLSVVSRSVTEVNLSSNQDASSQSLSAAESGIEAVLQNSAVPTGTPVGVGTGSQYTVTSRVGVGGGTSYQPADLFSGESATILLSTLNASGQFVSPAYQGNTFSVCWGRAGVGTPALEVNLYTKNGPDYDRTRRVYDSLGRVSGATIPLTGPPCPASYRFRGTIVIAPVGSGLVANFRILFDASNSHPIGAVVSAGNFFPDQGQVIEVQGQTGQTSRRVSVTQTIPAPPGILDNALFSGGDL